MTIVGVTGQIGSGKDTFSSNIIKIAKGKKVIRMRFSDLLRETLDLWSIPQTRHNLQYLAIIMDKEYGKGTLSRALEQRIKRLKADIVIIEGIRWQTDIPLIRSFKKNFLVYITAEQRIRFERVKKRAEKVDEKSLTFARFQKEDKEPTEIHIKKIGKNADVKLENNGSIKEYVREIEEFYTKYLSKA